MSEAGERITDFWLDHEIQRMRVDRTSVETMSAESLLPILAELQELRRLQTAVREFAAVMEEEAALAMTMTRGPDGTIATGQRLTPEQREQWGALTGRHEEKLAKILNLSEDMAAMGVE